MMWSYKIGEWSKQSFFQTRVLSLIHNKWRHYVKSTLQHSSYYSHSLWKIHFEGFVCWFYVTINIEIPLSDVAISTLMSATHSS